MQLPPLRDTIVIISSPKVFVLNFACIYIVFIGVYDSKITYDLHASKCMYVNLIETEGVVGVPNFLTSSSSAKTVG